LKAAVTREGAYTWVAGRFGDHGARSCGDSSGRSGEH
jgi:hypothetical protein